MAPPKKPIDEEQLRKLAQIHCTYEEMAYLMNVSTDTLSRRYADLINSARAEGLMSVRRSQFKVALSGNPTMLIWLGKILLQQKDTTEHIIKAATDDRLREDVAKMYGRIEHMARELRMKHIVQEPAQGLLVETCNTPQPQN